jgi:predicted P-loop ATPase/GTPase
MHKAILVSGLLPYESGKTYFTLSLATTLDSLGYKTRAFKPISAHSLWYQYRSFRESIRNRVLIGDDVIKYVKAGYIDNIDVSNPVDILTAVPDISLFRDTRTYLSTLEDVIAQAIIVRISTMYRRYFFIKDNYRLLSNTLRKQVNEALKVFGPYTEVNKEWLANFLVSKEISNTLYESARKLLTETDYLIIESFSNALIPSLNLSSLIDKIIIVTPSKALVYNVLKFRAYLNTVKRHSDLITSRFVSLFKPDSSIDIPPTVEWTVKPLDLKDLKYLLEVSEA